MKRQIPCRGPGREQKLNGAEKQGCHAIFNTHLSSIPNHPTLQGKCVPTEFCSSIGRVRTDRADRLITRTVEPVSPYSISPFPFIPCRHTRTQEDFKRRSTWILIQRTKNTHTAHDMRTKKEKKTSDISREAWKEEHYTLTINIKGMRKIPLDREGWNAKPKREWQTNTKGTDEIKRGWNVH